MMMQPHWRKGNANYPQKKSRDTNMPLFKRLVVGVVGKYSLQIQHLGPSIDPNKPLKTGSIPLVGSPRLGV